MMKKRRIAIVGAGPAGSAAAISLSRTRTAEVVLFDRAVFPRSKACGSGLSPWSLDLLDEMGLGSQIRAEAYPIRAARVGGRFGSPLELRSRYQAAILPRSRFDHLLVQEAVKRGALFRDGVRVLELERAPDGKLAAVKTSDGTWEVDAAVICEGANTTLARDQKPEYTLHTIMGWYEGVEDVIDAVELYFDPLTKPYYGWLFPESPTCVNIGIVFSPTSKTPHARARFEQFLEIRLASRIRHATQRGHLVGHPVHINVRPGPLCKEGVLIAGEAGGLVHAATAEGIHHALLSGMLAGGMLAEICETHQDFSLHRLMPYRSQIEQRLGGSLRTSERMRRFASSFAFDALFSLSALPFVRYALTWLLSTR